MVEQSSKDEPRAVRLDGWVAGADALQREMMEFVATRLEKDSEAIRGAITSGSLGDALTIQQQWVADTVNDYLVESTRVVSLLAQQVSAFPQFAAGLQAEAAGAPIDTEVKPRRAEVSSGATPKT